MAVQDREPATPAVQGRGLLGHGGSQGIDNVAGGQPWARTLVLAHLIDTDKPITTCSFFLFPIVATPPFISPGNLARNEVLEIVGTKSLCPLNRRYFPLTYFYKIRNKSDVLNHTGPSCATIVSPDTRQ